MALDRSKFSGAKVSALKDVQKSAKENDKNFSNEGRRLDFLSVDKGKNVFRILPPHPDDKIGASYLPYRVSQLKVETPVWKDGEKTDKTEIKNKKIFIATQHGGLPKDPIEMYIDYVRKRANDEFDSKEDKQKFLGPITGWKDKNGWNWGIAPKTSYVCYAIKNGTIGRLELWESWVKEMDKLAITEEADDVISVDPFSDPNEGFPLIISKEDQVDKQGRVTGKFDYIVTKDEPSRLKRESWPDFFTRTAVTDEQLEALLKQEPLSACYGTDLYTKKDFNFAIDGLRRLDTEYKFEIFENDEFLQELEDLEKLVPEDKVEEQKSGDDVKKMFDEKSESKSDDTDSGAVTPQEMKLALKKFIKKEFGDQYVDQIPSGSELARWYAIWAGGDGDELPVVIDKDAENSEETVDETSSMNEDEVSSDLAKLRALRRGGK